MGEISRELRHEFREDPWGMIKSILWVVLIMGLSIGIIVLAANLGD